MNQASAASNDTTETSLDRLTPPFATKIAIVVRDDLQTWQRLNVTAFLASGITAANLNLVGEAYRDADGQHYLPLLGVPVLVFQGSAETLAAARSGALERNLPIAVYDKGMFETGFDAANRAVVAGARSTDLDLVGLAVHGPKKAVDKIVRGAALHP